MDRATNAGSPFLISTPNVNFLVKSQVNGTLRESMLLSDLCLADGMPLIWIAKLLRIPIHERIAGSDLFGRLKPANATGRRLRVFLLGGAEGVAAAVGARLNAERGGLECVGVLNPGFGTIEEMSSPKIIDEINASNADLIAVFFGAEKAQAWLLHNHWRLRPPVRAQFGATINFEAGTVRRAPPMLDCSRASLRLSPRWWIRSARTAASGGRCKCRSSVVRCLRCSTRPSTTR